MRFTTENKKLREVNKKTGLFENLEEKTKLFLKNKYGYDLKQWIIEFGDHFSGTGLHTHRLDKWMSEEESLELFNLYNHGGYDFIVDSGAIDDVKEGWKVYKVHEFTKFDKDVIYYKKNKLFDLYDNQKLKDVNIKTGIFESKKSLKKETTIP